MAVAAFAYGVSTAQAADLGGNCCADLEERVAELEATTARKGNRKVSLTVSGHVAESIIFYDVDNEDLDEALGDSPQIRQNDNSISRFRFRGAADINADWSAGYLLEIAVPNSGDLAVRHNALYIRSKQLGTIWLGQTSQASDGALETSLAGMNDALTLGSLGNFGGLVADAQFGGVLSVDVSGLTAFDGGRLEVVKYRTPTIAGFHLSASWAGDGSETWDVALRYAGEFGGVRVAAAGFYRDEDDGARDVTGVSGSVMHVPTGLFVDGSWAQSDGEQNVAVSFAVPNSNIVLSGDVNICETASGQCQATFWGVRPGISVKATSLGKTKIAGHYETWEFDSTDIDLKRYGVSVIQNVDAAAMLLFFDYSKYDVSGDGLDNSDADVFILGAKLKF